MKKVNVFRITDMVLCFWIILFIAMNIVGQTRTPSLIIVTITSAISLSFVLFDSIRLRLRYNEIIKKQKIEVEKFDEEVASTFDDNGYRVVKQKVLESLIEVELHELYPNAKIIKNAICPKSNGTSTEIDLVMICTDGIFLIEAKNWNAKISGDWNLEYLTATYPNGTAHQVLNPIIQNSFHYTYLKSLLGLSEHRLFKNIVVLGDSVGYSKDEVKNGPTYSSVCYLRDLQRVVKYRSIKTQDILKPAQVDSIFSSISKALSSIQGK